LYESSNHYLGANRQSSFVHHLPSTDSDSLDRIPAFDL
jgi:hypothetical protein